LSEPTAFAELMERVRAGDQEAAAALVARYERVIRRTVRIWLVDARLRRVFDSMDICQSVLGSFFVRAALGQFHLESPDQLVRLLVQMARNKLTSQVRRQRAGRRDNRRLEGGDVYERELLAANSTPSRQVAVRDLLDVVRQRLTPDEQQLAEQRALGRDWPEIAAVVGGDPVTLRKRLTRAINRVSRELGLDDE
jgi:RNA polymerase sigma-70 factor (ECF subfamily)